MSQTMLIESLQDLRRRVKLLSVAYGVGVVVAAAVALIVGVVLIDWALALQFWPRLIVNLAALGTLGYALVRWVVRPALTKLSLTDLAGRLEHAFPQFDDRLRTTVNYHAVAVPGSDAMKQRTVAEATRMASDVDLGKAVVLKPVWYASGAAVGSVVLLAALAMLVDPNFRKIAVNHLLGGAEPWPKSVQIDMQGGVPRRVAVGQTVPVRLKLAKGNPKRVTVAYRYDDGRWTEEVMERGPDGIYAADLEARLDGSRQLGNLQIKVEAGDDDKVLPDVAIVPRLDVRGVIAHVRPPAYANLPAVPVNIAERPVVTAIGAEIALHVTFNKSLDTSKGVRLMAVDQGLTLPPISWSFPNEGEAVGRFVAPAAFRPSTVPSVEAASQSGKPAPPSTLRFVVRATDTDGFENTGTQEYQIVVHDDSMPTILIEDPKRSEDRTPNAVVPLKAVAEDDYGFDAVQLIALGNSPRLANKGWAIDLLKSGSVSGEGANWSPIDSTAERRRFRLEYGWALAKLAGADLQPGDVLEFGLRARDNFNLPGRAPHNPVDSARLKITIISHEQWDILRENQLAQIKQEIGQVKKNVDATRAEAQQQAKETAANKKLDEAQKATMGRLANQQSTATAQAKQIADKLGELVKKSDENKSPEKGMTETAKDVAKQLENAAENPMKQAAGELNEAKDQKADPKASPDQQADSAKKSAAAMEKAAENQGKASEQLQKAMDKLNDFGGLQPAIAKVQEIKDRQAKLAEAYKKEMKEALGKKAEELTDEQKKSLKEMIEKQDKLAEDTAKALKDMDAKADKLAKMDPPASKAMKEAAQSGQQQGIPQKQSDKKEESGASQKMEQNQQANAQQKHKEIDLGLEMMLNKLRDAERRKLEELQKDLAALQQLLTELIARQAGHNIDNLLIQDPSAKKVAEIAEADRIALFEQANRDLAKLAEAAKPELGVVTPSQEQTERNARDVVKKAEALPDPVPATKITASAAKMEQAIVFLRQSKLPDAYAPNQVEALKLLAEAKSAVDQAKKQADDKAKEEDEETIKKAFAKLLEAQQKLDAETAKIDATERDAEGNLPFLVGRRLGQLPGEQGELSAKAAELGKKLEKLKSIVYVWANKDIVTSMDEVKEDLAKPETGKGTQAEQKRIEEQLAAMIDNLNKKQEKKQFAEKQSGGGGGGGGGEPPPSMPTDVELRLLRDLQQAVNKSTTKMDAAKEKDAHKLLGLGGRQGELRNLLDQLLQQASKGKVKLAPEPDKKDQLPEEASVDDVEDQEFAKQLLDDNLQADTVEKSVKLTGDRMGRSRQRLALDSDPGRVTQEIQKRIILDLEDMIQLAQQQQQQSQSKPRPGKGKPKDQKPGGEEGQQEVASKTQGKGTNPKPDGQSPATESKMGEGGDAQVDASKALRETMTNWGNITQRERDAVMQGAGEKVFKKYEKFTDDYYRELAKRASER